jgi:hypothetical protein
MRQTGMSVLLIPNSLFPYGRTQIANDIAQTATPIEIIKVGMRKNIGGQLLLSRFLAATGIPTIRGRGNPPCNVSLMEQFRRFWSTRVFSFIVAGTLRVPSIVAGTLRVPSVESNGFRHYSIEFCMACSGRGYGTRSVPAFL